MSTRAELESALTKAGADWHRASDAMDRAHADRAKANADWDQIVTDRRKSGADRRKPGTGWNQALPNRRNADADRRIQEADIAALATAVADRHKAYLGRAKAEADRATAEAGLNAATIERDKAITALDALNGSEEGVAQAPAPAGRAVPTAPGKLQFDWLMWLAACLRRRAAR